MRSLPQPVPFKWKGNHHSYCGLFFIAFGLFNWYVGSGNGNLSTLTPLWQSFVVVGSYFIADDVVEHTITSSTPLRVLYRKLFNVKDG